MPCPMLQIDKNFFPDQMFFCHEDNCYLCSICYFNCHKNCKNKSIIKEKKNYCECVTEFHSIFNEIVFKFPIYDYQSQLKTNFWPIQMINFMFEGQIFDKLGNLLNGVLTNYNSKIPFNSDHPFSIFIRTIFKFFLIGNLKLFFIMNYIFFS